MRPRSQRIRKFSQACQHVARRAKGEIELHGVQIAPDDIVWLGLASANRDPRCCEEPDRFLIDRPGTVRHLGFSQGIHLCPGRHLAAIEAQLAIADLFGRFPRIELAEDPPFAYNANLFVHGLSRLPVRLNGLA